MTKSEPVRQITIDFPRDVKLTPEELGELLEKFTVHIVDEKSQEVMLQVKKQP
jgi:hypothetical protein